MFLRLLYVQSFFLITYADDLPTLYEYFTANGIRSGLSDAQTYFTLNNRNITIYSGALHYFRVPERYWRDRLRKFRAAGLNTVETYVPWNLHEFQDGLYDFGKGGSDFEEFLDVAKFIRLAQEEDLFVILRPGPYICAEWEFGGLPSWLLRNVNIKVRSDDPVFIRFVKRYFEELFKILAPLQFTKGGAIIAVQIENEYGSTFPKNVEYPKKIKKILIENGIEELLFTSDGVSSNFIGAVPGVLATINFQVDATAQLTALKKYQPNKPLMVMEFWSGWFDHWAEPHTFLSKKNFEKSLTEILDFGASVNFYMFHGGTNWGFLNGANVKKLSGQDVFNKDYQPDVTTYDYDAPLTEAGDYTPKYFLAKKIIKRYNKLKVQERNLPDVTERVAYNRISIVSELPLRTLLEQSPIIPTNQTYSMEMLPINNNSGQSYGYIVYKISNVNIRKNSILKIEGRVCDTVLVMVNGILKNKLLESTEDLNGFGFWKKMDSTLSLGDEEYKNATLELVVENWGRVNFGHLKQFNQFKGLWQGNVLLNDEILSFKEIIPLEFKRSWIRNLVGWRKPTFSKGPTLYKAILEITDPKDTYVDLRSWTKGIVIINDFVLARYLKLGPQLSAYLPATFLKLGVNDILVFEHFSPADTVDFTKNLIFI